MKTVVYNSGGNVVIALVTAGEQIVPPTIIDQEHAINFKTEDDTPFEELRDKVLPKTLLCVPGGTTSQDVGTSILSQAEIDGITSMECDLIYSVNLNNPIQTEQDQLDALRVGNQVSYVRFGNENYTYRANSEINATPDDQAAFDLGKGDGDDYVAECVPFIAGLNIYGASVVMVGSSESNQRNDKFNSYRRGFNSAVIEFCEGKSYLMDFHHYHRSPDWPLFDTALFEATLQLLGDTRAIIIESGAITGPSNHLSGTYTPYAIDTVQKVNASLRPTDIMGVHLLHQTNGVGLTTPDGTALSQFGEAFFELSKVKSIETPGQEGTGYTKKVLKRIPTKYAFFITMSRAVLIGDKRAPWWFKVINYSELVSPTGALDTSEKVVESFSKYFGK